MPGRTRFLAAYRHSAGLGRLLLGFLAGSTLTACAAPPETLDALLACHDRAVGGDALRSIEALEYRLEIEEPGFTAEGRYRILRAGALRMDVFIDGERVFSEGWFDGAAWQLAAGESVAVPASAEGAAALRHGYEQPGHLWSLADMEAKGHRIELQGEEVIDGERAAIVYLTLRDGFETWYAVDLESCLIRRSRNVRAFHPDLDPAKSWVETVFGDFRQVDGVTRSFASRNVDLSSGEELGQARVLEIATDPPGLDGESLRPPG